MGANVYEIDVIRAQTEVWNQQKMDVLLDKKLEEMIQTGFSFPQAVFNLINNLGDKRVAGYLERRNLPRVEAYQDLID